MNVKVLLGSGVAVALLGLGILTGSVIGSNQAFAQTPAATPTAAAGQSAPASPSTTAPQTAKPAAPSNIQAAITQQQAEQAALAASPGNTVDHTRLTEQNGTAVYDVDFTNGGGVIIDAQTGAVITVEAAGTDKGGGHHGRGGADQAALAAQATVTQQQAEQAALAASPGSTVDHSRLGQENGTVFWDVDFTNGGGAKVDAKTGAIIATEAPGTDLHGAKPAPSTDAP